MGPDLSANRREVLLAGAAVAASTIATDSSNNAVEGQPKSPSGPPNVVYFLVDNLGYGELGCYGGGILRGADTKRIDAFATQGMKLLNFALPLSIYPTCIHGQRLTSEKFSKTSLQASTTSL